MACSAVHSQFLYGLLIIHVVIVTSLISTGLYDPALKDKDAFNYGSNVGGIDLEGFKVLMATITHGFAAVCISICFLTANVVRCARVLPASVIIIILLFNFIFNLAGCACLWSHKLPNFPDGYARSIRANAILSSASLVYNIVIVMVYCYLRPPLDSAEPLGAPPGAQPAAQPAAQVAPAKKKSTTESKEKVKSAESAEGASEKKSKDKAAGAKEPPGPSNPTTNSAESKESKEKANIPQAARSKPADPTQSGKDKKSVKSEVIAPNKTPLDENLYSMDVRNVKTQKTMDMTDKDYFST